MRSTEDLISSTEVDGGTVDILEYADRRQAARPASVSTRRTVVEITPLAKRKRKLHWSRALQVIYSLSHLIVIGVTFRTAMLFTSPYNSGAPVFVLVARCIGVLINLTFLGRSVTATTTEEVIKKYTRSADPDTQEEHVIQYESEQWLSLEVFVDIAHLSMEITAFIIILLMMICNSADCLGLFVTWRGLAWVEILACVVSLGHTFQRLRNNEYILELREQINHMDL